MKNSPPKNRKVKNRKAIKALTLGLFCSLVAFQATAQWQLRFNDEKLPLTAENQRVLNQLLPLLKTPEQGKQLQFRFNRQDHAERYWQQLQQYFSQRGVRLDAHYSVQPSKDIHAAQLAISLVAEKDSQPCPGNITVSDTALPVPQSGLSVTHSNTVFVSPQARLTIKTAGDIKHNYYVFSHHPKTDQYRDIRQLHSQQVLPNLSEQGENYYLIAVPNGVNARDILQLQQRLVGSRGQYRQLNSAPDLDAISTTAPKTQRKAVGLNPITFSPQEVVGQSPNNNAQSQSLQVQACRLVLKPLPTES